MTAATKSLRLQGAPAAPEAQAARFRATILSPAAWRAHGEAFADLAARAAEPNPHMSPAAVFAAAATLLDPDDVTILTIADLACDSRLAGVWVLSRSRPAWAAGLPVLTAPALPRYEVMSQPVIDRTQFAPVLRRMFEAIAAAPLLPKLIHCPSVSSDGAFGREIGGLLPAMGAKLAVAGRWERAIMRFDGPIHFETYVRTAFQSNFKRRRTQWRNLLKSGEITTRIFRGMEALAAVPDFLALEASGWKGAAGTASACNEGDSLYMRRLAQGFALRDQLLVASLMRNGSPLAMGILLETAGRLVFLKTAYDEAERRLSPGVHLDLELTRMLIGEPGIVELDSGADDSVPADVHPWNERRAMSNLLIGVGGAPSAWIAAHGLVLRQRLRAAYARSARNRT